MPFWVRIFQKKILFVYARCGMCFLHKAEVVVCVEAYVCLCFKYPGLKYVSGVVWCFQKKFGQIDKTYRAIDLVTSHNSRWLSPSVAWNGQKIAQADQSSQTGSVSSRGQSWLALQDCSRSAPKIYCNCNFPARPLLLGFRHSEDVNMFFVVFWCTRTRSSWADTRHRAVIFGRWLNRFPKTCWKGNKRSSVIAQPASV